MKLRKPCQHDRYEAHSFAVTTEDDTGHFWTRNLSCPGGVFLPDDTLVIEKVDGEWPEWAKAAIHEWHILVQMDVVDHPASVLLDALSVREAE